MLPSERSPVFANLWDNPFLGYCFDKMTNCLSKTGAKIVEYKPSFMTILANPSSVLEHADQGREDKSEDIQTVNERSVSNHYKEIIKTKPDLSKKATGGGSATKKTVRFPAKVIFFDSARLGDLELMKALLKDSDSKGNQDLSVNDCTLLGQSALHLASLEGHSHVVEFL